MLMKMGMEKIVVNVMGMSLMLRVGNTEYPGLGKNVLHIPGTYEVFDIILKKQRNKD